MRLVRIVRPLPLPFTCCSPISQGGHSDSMGLPCTVSAQEISGSVSLKELNSGASIPLSGKALHSNAFSNSSSIAYLSGGAVSRGESGTLSVPGAGVNGDDDGWPKFLRGFLFRLFTGVAARCDVGGCSVLSPSWLIWLLRLGKCPQLSSSHCVGYRTLVPSSSPASHPVLGAATTSLLPPLCDTRISAPRP